MTSTAKIGNKVKFSHKVQAEEISEEVVNPVKTKVLINVSTLNQCNMIMKLFFKPYVFTMISIFRALP